MSAADQGTPAPSTSTTVPADQGPVEIIIGPKPASTDVGTKVDAPKAGEDGGADTAGTDEESHDSSGNHEDGTPRAKPRVQTRIDEITKARRAAEREVNYWKARALGTTTAESPAQTAAQPKPPARADFDSDEAHQAALNDFEFDKKVDKKVEEKLTTKNAQAAARAELEARVSRWQEQLEDTRQVYPDLDEVLDNAELPIADHIVELLIDHNTGAVLARHLALNPEELSKLNSMSVSKAALRLAEIALSVKATTKSSSASTAVETTASGKSGNAAPTAAPAVSRAVSKAPPPAAILGQGKATTPTLEDLSMDDYVARRKAQGATWAR